MLKGYAQKEEEYCGKMLSEIDKIENLDYNTYIEDLKKTEDFFNFKVKLIQVVTSMQSQSKNLFRTCMAYDVDTTKVSLIRSRLETLYEKIVSLGLNKDIIYQIVNGDNIKPSDLVLLPFEIEETTPYYYKEINVLINLYAFYLKEYTNYYNKMKNKEVTDSELVAFIRELNSIPENYKGLANIVLGNEPTDEMSEDHQRYVDLKNYLSSKVSLSTKDIKASNYSGLKDEVLDVMFEAIKWCKKESLKAYYSDLKSKKQNDYDVYEKNYNVYTEILNFNNQIEIYHVQPVLMIYNRYEKSFLNGWDGNKLETGEDYLIAPQVGAGIKDNNNQFTGIVIGAAKSKTSGTTKTGLFGYHSGVQSIFLDAAKGSATFGESGKGQIIIDPSDGGKGKAIIKSSTYAEGLEGEGMIIDFTTPEIKFGSGNFKVSSAGHLTAKGGGSIAGWTINNNELTKKNLHLYASDSESKIYSNSHSTLDSKLEGFYLSSDGLSIGGKFSVNGSTGSLISKLGSIGGWTISDEELNNGDLHITSTNKDGKIYSNSHSTLDSKVNGFYLSSDGLSIGKNFSVSYTGHLTAKDLNVEGAKIGGWTIGESTISSNGVILNSEGSISVANGWSLDKNGNATFNNITCNSIWSFNSSSNWKFTNSALSLGSSTPSLNSDGVKVEKNGNTINLTIAGNIYAKNGYFKGIVYATSGEFIGSIKATSIDFEHIDGDKRYYLNMNQTTDHPNVSGLNIGWGGLVFGKSTFSGYGIRDLSNIGSGGAVLHFKPSLGTHGNVNFNYDYLYTESKMVFKDSSLLMIGSHEINDNQYLPDRNDNPSTGRPYTRTIQEYIRDFIQDSCYNGDSIPTSGSYISFKLPGTNTWYPCAMHKFGDNN